MNVINAIYFKVTTLHAQYLKVYMCKWLNTQRMLGWAWTLTALLEELVEVERGGAGVSLLGSRRRRGRLFHLLHGIIYGGAGIRPVGKNTHTHTDLFYTICQTISSNKYLSVQWGNQMQHHDILVYTITNYQVFTWYFRYFKQLYGAIMVKAPKKDGTFLLVSYI